MALDQVLIKDPATTEENSFGSYFVYRKLEQNVKAYKENEIALAKELFGAKANQQQKELTGAYLMGRFENGMPVLMSDQQHMLNGTKVDNKKVGDINDFDYKNDPDGAKCPFHSHVRKTNTRKEHDKAQIMARRGIVYGQRDVHPNDAKLEEMPTEDVGLLFMAFQNSITGQFEIMQKFWAKQCLLRRAKCRN